MTGDDYSNTSHKGNKCKRVFGEGKNHTTFCFQTADTLVYIKHSCMD